MTGLIPAHAGSAFSQKLELLRDKHTPTNLRWKVNGWPGVPTFFFFMHPRTLDTDTATHALTQTLKLRQTRLDLYFITYEFLKVDFSFIHSPRAAPQQQHSHILKREQRPTWLRRKSACLLSKRVMVIEPHSGQEWVRSGCVSSVVEPGSAAPTVAGSSPAAPSKYWRLTGL